MHTQIKLHFEKTNYVLPKKPFNCTALLLVNSTCNCGHVFFSLLKFNIFSGRKLVISIWKQSKIGSQYLKAFNAKQSKSILKDAIPDLEMIWVAK